MFAAQPQGLPLRNLDEFRCADATRRIAAEQSLRLRNLTLCPLRGGLPRRRLYRSGLAAQAAMFGKASGQEQKQLHMACVIVCVIVLGKTDAVSIEI